MKTQLTFYVYPGHCCLSECPVAKNSERPMNVVYILADDLDMEMLAVMANRLSRPQYRPDGEGGNVVYAALCRMYGECPSRCLDDRIAYGTYASPGKSGDHARRPTADAGGYLYVG